MRIVFDIIVISIVYFWGYRIGFHFGVIKVLKDVEKNLNEAKDKFLEEMLKASIIKEKKEHAD